MSEADKAEDSATNGSKESMAFKVILRKGGRDDRTHMLQASF